MAGSRTSLGEMFAWLASDDARAAAAAELHRRALPVALVDDVLGAAAIAVGAAAGTDALVDVANPVAYARRVVTTKTIDLLRGRIRSRAHETDLDDELDVPSGDGDSAAEFAAAEMEDNMRVVLHPLLAGRRPWAAAAALTAVTLAVHRDVALPQRIPTPDAASAGVADRWAALWLAGVRDCFPTDNALDDAAMRQRRSRALRAVDAVLREAAATIGLGVSGG